MVKTLILSTALFAGTASLSPASAQKFKGANTPVKSEVKFLENISLSLAATPVTLLESATKPTVIEADKATVLLDAPSGVELATDLQLKYAILLDTEVESVVINTLFQTLDAWWGTRYQYGGSSRNGIDCSAFMQVIYNAHFNIALPRTAKEQYESTERIERDALKEGDLVFFNTRGGVSHVGVYLQNNKFAHAATSSGVMISDLDETYWAQRYLGAGRTTPTPVLLTAL